MADIGATLREARMRARIDITEVETRTKIRAKYLRAIENEEWDLLPGPVYAKSFLRTYGDYLGLDSRMLVDDFKRRYERPSDHELRPITALGRERERRQRGPLLPPWAVIGLVLVVVAVTLALIGLNGGTNKLPTAATTTTTPHTHHARHHAKPVSPATPRAVRLQLTPTGPVYVCVVNGAGLKLINQQTYAVGQAIPGETATRLLLTLGNNSVRMKVNGHSVPVAPSANPIRLLIDPGGVHTIPLAMKPTC